MSIVAVMGVFKITVADVPTLDRIVALCRPQEAFARVDPVKQHGAPTA